MTAGAAPAPPGPYGQQPGGGYVPPRQPFGPPGAWGAPAGRPSGKRYGFNCGYCSSRLEATEAMAAQEGQCPTCGNNITIPILDRYGRLIDPKTRQIIKQDPHPVHAYAAAGERAPQILRGPDGKQAIRCPRCGGGSPITANNCKGCGMPFTMEGTTLEAAGSSNGFCVASLVLGIIGLIPCTFGIPSALALIFGIIGYNQVAKSGGQGGGKGMSIAGMIMAVLGFAIAAFAWLR
jgi:DNA-directed RNA polymerase subunit RPC12/RpoP